MNSSRKRNNVVIPVFFWDLLEENYGHITKSKSAQLRLVLHLWAEDILRGKVKDTEINQSLEVSK